MDNTGRETMEGSENTEVSDSTYYNSCCNSQSRSSRSSKSITSNSLSLSSRSSGYGGAGTNTGGSSEGNSSTSQGHGSTNKGHSSTNKGHSSKNKGHNCTNKGHTSTNKGHTSTNKGQPPEKRIKEKKKTIEINVDKAAETTTTEPNKNTVIKKLENALSPSHAPKHESVGTEIITEACATNKADDSFSCVISMHDGVVIYTTISLTASLGFPKEMWIGRSFIDFIHPSDRDTFASQITVGLAVPKNETDVVAKRSENPAVAGQTYSNASMTCRVRRYRCLTTGFTIKERVISYLPFLLNLSFKNFADDNKGPVNYLVIQASQIYSAFKENNQHITDPTPFTMRHTASGLLQYIDQESVPYLGYIPQDIVNSDFLQLYHPDDLFYLSQVYEHIVREGGMPRSKTYRLLTQNGEYLKVETEWSSFINPWSKKLEFVTGKHYVIEGPANPDVFQSAPIMKKIKSYETDEDKSQILRSDIVRILTEVLTKPAKAAKQQVDRRCQDIASFMDILFDGQTTTQETVVHPSDTQLENTVMLGGVSPHHDHSDSKSSTGTQSSYTYLNYNENLQRYFTSQAPFTDEMCKSDRLQDNKERQNNCKSPALTYSCDSGDLSSDSSGMLIPLKALLGVPPILRLTEMLLTKHNKSMQKEMINTHSGKRGTTRRWKKSSFCRQKRKEHLARCNAAFQLTESDSSEFNQQDQLRGVKRMSSVSPPARSRQAKKQCYSMHLPYAAAATQATATTDTLTVVQHTFDQTIGTPVTYQIGLNTPEQQRPTSNNVEIKRNVQNTKNFELSTRNYEEACKHVLPMNMDIEKKTIPRIGPKPIFGKNMMFRNQLHSTNALNRSNEAVPEGQLLRGVHHKSSDDNRTSDDTYERTDGGSSYSSFYSSLLRTDSGSITDSTQKLGAKLSDQQEQDCNVSAEKTFIKRRLGAPWTENVKMTQELIYNYQVIPKSLEETLENDRKLMIHMDQPLFVKEQLEQLKFELEIEDVTAQLTLEDGFSSCSEDGSPSTSTKVPSFYGSRLM